MMLREDKGLKLENLIPIKWIMRGNTGATYQYKGSKTRRGERGCPFQKQGFTIGQIKYILQKI